MDLVTDKHGWLAWTIQSEVRSSYLASRQNFAVTMAFVSERWS